MANPRIKLEDEVVNFLVDHPSDAEIEAFFRASVDRAVPGVIQESTIQGTGKSLWRSPMSQQEALNAAEPGIEEGSISESSVADPVFAARESMASKSPSPVFDRGSERLRKTCLLMVNLLRRRKLKINEQILKLLAQEMNEDIGEVSNILSTIRTGSQLANAFGGPRSQWQFETLEVEKPEPQPSKQPQRALKKLAKIRNAKPKNPNLAPLRRPKFVPLVHAVPDKPDVNMDQDAREEPAVFMPDRHMNPERTRFLLGQNSVAQVNEVACGRDDIRGIIQQTDMLEAVREPTPQRLQGSYLLDEIEADLARTRVMFGLDADTDNIS